MSTQSTKQRLIKRLEWYYPTERMHAFLTFPAIAIGLLFFFPVNQMIFVLYGLLVCIYILYQGQHYWKLKLWRLKGQPFDTEKNLRFFKQSKIINLVLIGLMPLIYFLQFQVWESEAYNGGLRTWGWIAAAFAVAEYINYYHIQLSIDNAHDVAYIKRNKRLKKAKLAIDLKDGTI